MRTSFFSEKMGNTLTFFKKRFIFKIVLNRTILKISIWKEEEA